MKAFLSLYKQKGLIKEETIGFDQVIKHLDRARKDLHVASANLRIDTEAAYNYAYLAMLRSGRALMLSFKHRPIDGEQHKTVVAFCEHVLGRDNLKIVRHFDRMRKKRNRFTYDEPGLLVSKTETEQAFKNAKEFVEKIHNFIQDKNPQKKLL
ncbi:MAG: HEPN domain-containing protein [Candidatus Paceibacterota bacterium]|nr:HEPN domain-containing protein [Candidatus Paceibacterota bacterium]MDD5555443.1 HEPN domain-containing protein [Candidatus Paceibacterota bacterium]